MNNHKSLEYIILINAVYETHTHIHKICMYKMERSWNLHFSIKIFKFNKQQFLFISLINSNYSFVLYAEYIFFSEICD